MRFKPHSTWPTAFLHHKPSVALPCAHICTNQYNQTLVYNYTFHLESCNGFPDFLCSRLSVYSPPESSQKCSLSGNTYHFIAGVTQMSSGWICVCVPEESRCPPKYLQCLSQSNSMCKYHTSATSHSRSLLSPPSLTVLHWIINIFGLAAWLSCWLGTGILWYCAAWLFVLKEECTRVTNALSEIMRDKVVNIIGLLDSNSLTGSVGGDANTCCRQSHASPAAVDPAALGLFLLDLEAEQATSR